MIALKLICTFGILIAAISCSQYSEPQGLGNSRAKDANQKLENAIKVDATFESIKANILEKKCIGCHGPDGDKEAKQIPLGTEKEVMTGSSGSGDLVAPGDPNSSVLYQSVASFAAIRKKIKQMPPANSKHAQLSGDDVMAIAAWITGLSSISGTGGSSTISPQRPSSGSTSQCPTLPSTAEPLIPEPAVLDFAFIKTQILEKKCVSCHKADGKADELVFGNYDELIKLKNEFGQLLVVPGKPNESLLYLSLLKDKPSRRDTRWMPPRKDLNEGTIKDISNQETLFVRKWIENGAR